MSDIENRVAGMPISSELIESMPPAQFVNIVAEKFEEHARTYGWELVNDYFKIVIMDDSPDSPYILPGMRIVTVTASCREVVPE